MASPFFTDRQLSAHRRMLQDLLMHDGRALLDFMVHQLQQPPPDTCRSGAWALSRLVALLGSLVSEYTEFVALRDLSAPDSAAGPPPDRRTGARRRSVRPKANQTQFVQENKFKQALVDLHHLVTSLRNRDALHAACSPRLPRPRDAATPVRSSSCSICMEVFQPGAVVLQCGE